MPNRYFSREDRKQQIELALKIQAQNGVAFEATAYRVAKLVDMAVSANLYSLLSDMVAERRLTVRDEVIPNRCTRTFYALPQSVLNDATKRDIVINGKRVPIQEKLL